MCGITGFWQSPAATQDTMTSLIKCMADTMVHRGPDDSGVWVDATAGIALGFRRLAILDLSPTGHQQMFSSDGRFVVVFNGEIYNHRDLRAELENRGVRFRGTSDTEVILEGASQWGAEAMIPRLWGMFAVALWDRQERTLVLSRDRIGKKPLYYGEMNGVFAFGSELKALRAHRAFQAEIDRDALAMYLRYGYVPAPFSIYKGIHKLMPGCYALIRLGKPPDIRPYWEARQVVEHGISEQLSMSDADAIEALDALLRDATAWRMIADVPLGALLSGGIDSSTIVALMQAQSTRPIKTFTIGFHIPGYNEAESAKAVARHLGTVHTELYVTPEETQAVIPRLPDLYDEPFADSSQIPTFLVCRLARQHVTVSLSGDGGDELFGGYNRYVWAEEIWNRLRYFPSTFRRAAARGIQSVPPASWDAVYRNVVRWLPTSLHHKIPGDKLHKLAQVLTSYNQDDLYRRLISSWKSPHELLTFGQERTTILNDTSIRSTIQNYTERMMFLDLVTYLPDDILVKVDRASMGVSLEARSPLLDHRVVEWVWRMPPRFKIRDGQSKWLLRQVLYRYVPSGLVERPKAGFGIPIDVWLRGPLRDWADSLLNENRIEQEGFFRPEPIRRAWTEHLSGVRNNQSILWVILMFQAWQERWLGT